MNKLICNDVCKSFRIGNDNLNVLNNINLTIEENDTVATMISESLHFGLYQDTADPYFSEPKGGWKWVDGSYLYDSGGDRTLCGVLLNDKVP